MTIQHPWASQSPHLVAAPTTASDTPLNAAQSAYQVLSGKDMMSTFPPNPPQYEKEKFCLDLNTCIDFKSLTVKLRHHLFASAETGQIFVNICKEAYMQVPETERRDLEEPSLEHFRSVILHQWPTIKTVPPQCKIHSTWWKSVGNEIGKPNTVRIMSELVAAFQRRAEEPNPAKMSSEEYALIIVTVILHELMHIYIKICLDEHVTPKGVGDDTRGDGLGEAGWKLEEILLGGKLVAEWANEDGTVSWYSDLNYIRRILLQSDSKFGLIGISDASDFILSLSTDKLKPPSFLKLRPQPLICPPENMRFRLSEGGKRYNTTCRIRI